MFRKYVLNVAETCEMIFRDQLAPGGVHADRDDLSEVVLFFLGAGPVVIAGLR